MAKIDDLFKKMLEEGASDLHLSADRKPMIRASGDMVPLLEETYGGETIRALIYEIMPERNIKQFEEIWDSDFAYELPGFARFRGNIFMDRNGVGGVFRQIPEEILTAEQLGLPPVVQEFCYLSKGLVVVTGPTGSGKSTTLAAMIDLINKNRTEHLITIEDPVEFVHQDQKCLINQREVHRHTKSFKNALRAALRQDPDIILVGELRDLETIEIAIETAETGHLVFGTLHTNTAGSTVDRIIDQFSADRQAQIRTMLASSLKGVIAQTLCKKKPKGRIAALEILVVTSAVSSMIRDGKTFQIPSTMQIGKKFGMQVLNDDLMKYVLKGIVDPLEAYVKSVDKDDIVNRFKQNGIDFEPPSKKNRSAPEPAAPKAPPKEEIPKAEPPKPAAPPKASPLSSPMQKGGRFLNEGKYTKDIKISFKKK